MARARDFALLDHQLDDHCLWRVFLQLWVQSLFCGDRHPRHAGFKRIADDGFQRARSSRTRGIRSHLRLGCFGFCDCPPLLAKETTIHNSVDLVSRCGFLIKVPQLSRRYLVIYRLARLQQPAIGEEPRLVTYSRLVSALTNQASKALWSDVYD